MTFFKTIDNGYISGIGTGNGGIQLWTGVQLELDALAARIAALEGA